jgi:glycerate kinase
MKVVIAPDKFKGSLTAPQAAEAIARGVQAACPDATLDLVPMADGGEGTVAALVSATKGTIRRASVTNPLGRPVEAEFGLLGDGRTAVIEMAAASGLVLVPPDQRDPRWTSTRGTGELILAAIEAGASHVIVGIGGSATNDGGAGMAQALGYRLLDKDGQEIPPGGGNLGRLSRIERPATLPAAHAQIDVACDVDNPLCGPRGATAVYGPQKGATPPIIAGLDANLRHLAGVIERDLGRAVADLPGAGAAGGLGAGLVAFAGGRLRPGVELVIEAVGLERRLARADLCLTAEGAIDHQTAHGKTPVGVSRLARSLGVPALALAGTLGEGAEAVLHEGIDAYFSICSGPMALEEAIERAGGLLASAAEQAVRAFLAGRAHAERSS